jgi:hypothetical protein
MSAQAVDQHGALPHQQFARPMQHQHALLLDGNRTPARPPIGDGERDGIHRPLVPLSLRPK